MFASERIDNTPDLVIGFITNHHAQRVGMIADAIRKIHTPKHLMLMTAAGIMGDDAEIEEKPGVSLIGFKLPGVEMHPYMLDATWARDRSGGACIEDREHDRDLRDTRVLVLLR